METRPLPCLGFRSPKRRGYVNLAPMLPAGEVRCAEPHPAAAEIRKRLSGVHAAGMGNDIADHRSAARRGEPVVGALQRFEVDRFQAATLMVRKPQIPSSSAMLRYG